MLHIAYENQIAGQMCNHTKKRGADINLLKGKLFTQQRKHCHGRHHAHADCDGQGRQHRPLGDKSIVAVLQDQIVADIVGGDIGNHHRGAENGGHNHDQQQLIFCHHLNRFFQRRRFFALLHTLLGVKKRKAGKRRAKQGEDHSAHQITIFQPQSTVAQHRDQERRQNAAKRAAQARRGEK